MRSRADPSKGRQTGSMAKPEAQASDPIGVFGSTTSSASRSTRCRITRTTALSNTAASAVTADSGVHGTLSSAHDPAGRRTRLTWNDGFSATYDYDATGRMTAVRENGSLLLASYGYDDLGRRVSRMLGNGTSTTYGYDGASRLATLTLNGGGQPTAASFGYAPSGQIASRTLSNDAYAWAGAVDADRAYAVNGLNQHMASGTVVPTYDGRGNLTAAGGARYLHNGENQLSGANGTHLYYDASGRLDQVTQSGLGWQWDGDRPVTEFQGGGIARRYVHGAATDEPLLWYEVRARASGGGWMRTSAARSCG